MENDSKNKYNYCTVKPRSGESLLLDSIVPNLNGYAIIPIEEYEELQRLAHPSLQEKIYKEMDEEVINEILGEDDEEDKANCKDLPHWIVEA